LLSGHSDVAIGTRLSPGSRVVRGRKREFISRGYNRLLHTVLDAKFSDAQCGFKAVRREAARRLLPVVRDDGWFFDTELLMAAQREGMRIHEVPVDWVDDPDSRVELVRTAVEDLRGIARLLAEARLIRFMAVGVVSTIAYALLYLLLRGPLGAEARTRSRSRSPRSPTRTPTGASRSASPGGASWCASTRWAPSSTCSRSA